MGRAGFGWRGWLSSGVVFEFEACSQVYQTFVFRTRLSHQAFLCTKVSRHGAPVLVKPSPNARGTPFRCKTASHCVQSRQRNDRPDILSRDNDWQGGPNVGLQVLFFSLPINITAHRLLVVV